MVLTKGTCTPDRIGKLSERERVAMLRTFDDLVRRIPVRSVEETERELAAVRKARGSGGRRHRL